MTNLRPGELILGGEQHVASAPASQEVSWDNYREMTALLEEIADSRWGSEDKGGTLCRFCGAYQDDDRHAKHQSDCFWQRARRLMGKED